MQRHAPIALALLASLTSGCDGQPAAAPDAGGPPPDAAPALPDAATPCPGTGGSGPVTVQPGVGREGESAELLVNDATGAPVSRHAVDDGAPLAIDVPPCGMVTLAIQPEFSSRRHHLTWVRVQPGDLLVAPRPPGWRQVSFQVEFPARDGATSYRFSGAPAGGAEVTASPAQLEQLTFDDEVAVLGVAVTDEAYVWAGATASLAPDGPTVVALEEWQTDVAEVALEVTGLPPVGESVELVIDTLVGDSPLLLTHELAGWPGETASFGPFVTPAGFGAGRVTLALHHMSTSGDRVQLARLLAAEALAIDQADLLPLPSAFEVTGELPRPEATWDGDAGDADLVILELHSSSLVWWVVAPPDQAAVRLPSVPAHLRPAEDFWAHTVALADLDEVGDYSAALAELPALNAPSFTSSSHAYRMSLVGDLDPRIIELP